MCKLIMFHTNYFLMRNVCNFIWRVYALFKTILDWRWNEYTYTQNNKKNEKQQQPKNKKKCCSCC